MKMKGLTMNSTYRLNNTRVHLYHMFHDLNVQAAFLSGINAFVSPKRLILQMFNILLMDRSSGIRSEKSILLISIYYECNRDLIAHSNKISETIAQETVIVLTDIYFQTCRNKRN